MKPKDLGPRARKFQDPAAALEALANWDDLAAADLREIEADPHLAPRLGVLRAAEDWLERGAGLAGDCPSAEELYEYGGGPGSSPLSAEATRRLEDHLFGCTDCEELLGTLANTPPSPLEFEPVENTLPAPRRPRAPRASPIVELAARSRRRRLGSIAMACAATLIVGFALWSLFEGRDTSVHLPNTPLLRGESEIALYYPRGQVLEAPNWGAASLPLRFELRPVAEASSYRVEILRHGGGAFENGTAVQELRGGLEELALPARLASGAYTWHAYASVNGLERDLGARDFEVGVAPALLEKLAQSAGSGEPAGTLQRITLLHDAGDWTDARELARTLPASAERDRYLERVPGR
ncbi:MAG: hypothetical protein IPJ19_17095 [Planctomycetes bacterium]|nr:hypothetical protein [Planctomycetota bacterium]